MKKTHIKRLLIFALLIYSPIIFAQNIYPVWEKCYAGEGMDKGTSLIQVGDYYYIVGTTTSINGDVSYNHGNEDIWFLKTDLHGNLISERTFGGSLGEGAPFIKSLSDSVYYIVGVVNSDDGDVSYNPCNSTSTWIIKIKETGEKIWDKVIGGSCKDIPDNFFVTADSGIIILSHTCSQDGDISNYYGYNDTWIVKLSKNGEIQWDNSYGGIGIELDGTIVKTFDGGYIIASATDGAGGGNYDSLCNHHHPLSGFPDIWVVKIDSLGDIQWQQCYGGYFTEYSKNILVLNDGYLLLGATNSNDGDVSGFHGTPAYNSPTDIWVVKIDLSGNIIWQKCLGGRNWDYARNIFPTSDSGFMIIGVTGSNDGDVEGYNGAAAGVGEDIWLAKISSIGDLEWQYCYGGLEREHFTFGALQKGDYNYVLTLGSETDEWQCNGSLVEPSLRLVELDDTTTSIDEKKMTSINVYPSPATNTLKIENNYYTEPYIIEIYNSTGVKALNIKAANKETLIDISNWNSGIYIIRVLVNNSIIDTPEMFIKKIVVK